MASLQVVVEFGGGYGDVAAMAREMGFRGTHVVYDLLPALLLQQYFHRTSNWPSYLLPPPPDTHQEQGSTQEGQEPMQEDQKYELCTLNCHLLKPPFDYDDDTDDGDDDSGLAAVLVGKTVLVPASTPRAMLAGVRRATRASSSTPGMT